MTGRKGFMAVLEQMRLWQYCKNVLVFVPLFFSGQFLSRPQKLIPAAIGFAALSLASSGIYTMNDCQDVREDRLHPRKCKRPIPSGRISMGQAAVLAVVLMLAAFALILCGGAVRGKAFALLLCYVAINIAYSMFKMKQVPVVDVTIVAMGFVLRILLGAAMTDVAVSRWLMLTVMMGSYFMALGKRRGELRHVRDKRQVLRFYTDGFLTQNMYMFLTMTLVFYSLWSVDAQTTASHANSCAVISIIPVLMIVMRYSLDIEGDSEGDPTEVLLHDRWLLALVLVYALLMFAVIYIG